VRYNFINSTIQASILIDTASMPQLARTLSNALQKMKLAGQRESGDKFVPTTPSNDTPALEEIPKKEELAQSISTTPSNDTPAPNETSKENKISDSKVQALEKEQKRNSIEILVCKPGSEVPSHGLTFGVTLEFEVLVPINDVLGE